METQSTWVLLHEKDNEWIRIIREGKHLRRNQLKPRYIKHEQYYIIELY